MQDNNTLATAVQHLKLQHKAQMQAYNKQYGPTPVCSLVRTTP